MDLNWHVKVPQGGCQRPVPRLLEKAGLFERDDSDTSKGTPITYKPGAPSPTPCNSNCGELCTGFYCQPNPTGTPPDFGDPANPDNQLPLPTDHFRQTYRRPIQVVTTLPVAHGQPRFSAMAAEDIRCASPRQRYWSSLLPPHRRRPGPDDGGGGMPAPTSCDDACKLDKGNPCT